MKVRPTRVNFFETQCTVYMHLKETSFLMFDQNKLRQRKYLPVYNLQFVYLHMFFYLHMFIFSGKLGNNVYKIEIG